MVTSIRMGLGVWRYLPPLMIYIKFFLRGYATPWERRVVHLNITQNNEHNADNNYKPIGLAVSCTMHRRRILFRHNVTKIHFFK
jgi:hypothetical protein